MPQILLPRAVQAAIAGWLREEGVLMQRLPREPVRTPNATWQHYGCQRGPARAGLILGEHEQKPEHVVATVGGSLAFWRPRQLVRNWKLTREIYRILLAHGGERIED